MTTVTRPALRYHGGKWRIAPWIISHFPAHRVYIEPFGGAASVLLRKPRSYGEVYNDLDGEIVNLFRVLRDPVQARELIRQLGLTPYARAEFETSYLLAGDPIEQARRTIVRSYMGHGSTLTGKWTTGFRGGVTRARTHPAHDWQGLPGALEQTVDRLQGVVIENRPALAVIEQYDRPETLFYIDPPYPLSTRNERWATAGTYRHEMTDDQHRELAAVLHEVRGYVVLSGYECSLYDELYASWPRVTKRALADQALDRLEVLWLSPKTQAACLPLFDIDSRSVRE